MVLLVPPLADFGLLRARGIERREGQPRHPGSRAKSPRLELGKLPGSSSNARSRPGKICGLPSR